MSRSKEFEVNVVLDKAMILFWEQGYEKTSMSDLVKHMGIHRRSLYDTFGDKHSLFLQAMDRYINKSNVMLTGEVKQSKTAKEALQKIFRFMVLEEADSVSGCLLVNSVTELSARDSDVDTRTIKSFELTELMFEQVILWGQRDGEFSLDYDAKEMAENLHTLSVGIRVMARSSMDKEKLFRIVDISMGQLIV
ncbi:helix-turn-helix transcriptional regulator [Paenibacillus sp. SZ31]|uniref:TetR/AcrR family transcriptional regulator n=1 Tax=Paenibacillus sp. SZ31 TaxID=2725555 RepID=UPI00146BF615|nr:TetR/AcrR family transcriptional regulator [Paenibacillus sp. SZ31]NMI03365.1 helix-turn-helix transcriptional regulator [Paenibacillus sp. SZ31]